MSGLQQKSPARGRWLVAGLESTEKLVASILRYHSPPQSWRDGAGFNVPISIILELQNVAPIPSQKEASPTLFPSHYPTPIIASSTFDSNYLFTHPPPQQTAHLSKGWAVYLPLNPQFPGT